MIGAIASRDTRRGSRRGPFYRPAIARRLIPYLLILPALTLIVALGLALASLILESLGLGRNGDSFNWSQYVKVLTTPHYLDYFVRSLRMAAWSTLACLVLGYPIAYYMEMTSKRLRHFIVIFLVLMFFSDYVLRMYALVLVVGNNGLINRGLLWLDLVGSPVRFMYSELGVVIGLTAANIAFMVLSINSVLARLDRNLLDAAYMLGAGHTAAFIRITLPLTVPGIFAGSIIVFLLSMNSFLAPTLLGGGFVQMIANLVYQQAISMWNVPLAAAASTVLLLFVVVMIIAVNLVYDRLGRRIGAA